MIDLSGIRLCIFDVDGTLVATKSGETFRQAADDWQWLPGRLEKLQELKAAGIAIRFASNQGGVALEYLDEGQIVHEFLRMGREIGYPAGHNIMHVCFTHPKAKLAGYLQDSNRRKPNPGMLWEAMLQENTKQHETLMVGDRDEDKGAARNAGMAFVWASEFFA